MSDGEHGGAEQVCRQKTYSSGALLVTAFDEFDADREDRRDALAIEQDGEEPR